MSLTAGSILHTVRCWLCRLLHDHKDENHAVYPTRRNSWDHRCLTYGVVYYANGEIMTGREFIKWVLLPLAVIAAWIFGWVGYRLNIIP